MSRRYGAVWSTSWVTDGALQLRFVATAGFDGKWVWAKSVVPADWEVGGIYRRSALPAMMRVGDRWNEGDNFGTNL